MPQRKIRARDVFEAFLLKHHKNDIRNILENCDDDIHYSLEINFLSLSEEHVEVAEAILASPIRMLSIFDAALIKALTQVYDEEKSDLQLTLKLNVHVRLTGLPRYPELYRHSVPHSNDVNRLLCITGTVVRTVSPKMLECQREYMCLKCKHIFVVKADYALHYQLCKPPRCPNPVVCYSTNFSLNDSGKKFSHTKDYQEIKIQEQPQKLLVGTIPRSIWVTLEDDLVDSAKPGDEVLVCGVVLQRWQAIAKGTRPSIDLVIKTNNLTVHNKQRTGNVVTNEILEEFKNHWKRFEHDLLSGRNLILSAFCPQVYGLYVVKLSVAMVIAGGIQKVDANGTRVRGESHLLLVGDPGTGKSQFLKYVSNLVPRCVLTTGIGTTSAGLTVSAIREEGEWALEAGALILADGGICCIDEFNCIREVDRAAIHEAMEQQTISVAKAGIVCKLNSRCSILAATNPKGRYDVDEPLNVNVALASPLLSRFDIILVLQDSINPEWDKVVSSYILDGKDPLSSAPEEVDEHAWTLEHLRSYFSYIRTLQPKMTREAHVILTKYYQLQRQTDQRNQARTTIRLLESLARLSQGHARLLMKEEVTAMDAVVAVTLIEASMCGASLIKGGNALHTSFPSSPSEEYKQQVQVILQTLGLVDILANEIKRLRVEENLLRNKPKGKVSSVKAKNDVKTHVDPSCSTGNNLKRAFLQDSNCFTNILEMNECFVDEENDTTNTDTEVKNVKKRKSNKRLKMDNSNTEKNKVEDPEGSTEHIKNITQKGTCTPERDDVSPKIPRKYFKRSELKNTRTRPKRGKKDVEVTSKSPTHNNHLETVTSEDKSPRDNSKFSQKGLVNSFLDQSLQKLSQDLIDFDDFEPTNNSPVYKCRKSFALLSSTTIKRPKGNPLSTSNTLDHKTRKKDLIQEEIDINLESQIENSNNSIYKNQTSENISEEESFSSNSNKENVTESSSKAKSVHKNSPHESSLKLDLKRFAFSKSSSKKLFYKDQQNEDNKQLKPNIINEINIPTTTTNVIPTSTAISTITTSNCVFTSNYTSITNTNTTVNSTLTDINNRSNINDVNARISPENSCTKKEPSAPKNSFIEKLKKFSYKSSSNDSSVKQKEKQDLMDENSHSQGNVNGFSGDSLQQETQNSAFKVPSQISECVSSSGNKEKCISIFDDLDEDLDFDF